jgi:diaminohydroxyphosphoribosylaminopyrimidine deaminase/5-amino-6-(5-phosphoribosylamino)uracil reductase
VDAILVGRGTAQADDPSLTVRLPGHRRRDGWPLRVLLDPDLRVSPKAKLFQGDQRTLVFCARSALARREKALSRKGAWVFRVPGDGKMLSLRPVLKALHSLGVRSLMVEGGGKVHSSFLREGLADEAALFVAARKAGAGPFWDLGKVLPAFKDLAVEPVGEDFLLRGKFMAGPRSH